MTDIVEWLRAYANRTTVIDIKRLDEAAAEIERLRAGGCARDQGTTQYCAEAAKLAAENERLRAALRQVAAYKADDDEMDWADAVLTMNAIARAALGEGCTCIRANGEACSNCTT